MAGVKKGLGVNESQQEVTKSCLLSNYDRKFTKCIHKLTLKTPFKIVADDIIIFFFQENKV